MATVRYGGADLQAVAAALSAAAGPVCERRVHFTLRRLLRGGELGEARRAAEEAAAEVGEGASGSPAVDAALPSEDAALGSAAACPFSGRRVRLAAYDVVRHLEAHAADCAVVPSLELFRYALLHIEARCEARLGEIGRDWARLGGGAAI